MSYFFAIILLLIIVWILFGDRIKRAAQRRMMEHIEDAFRAQMGMPSAKEQRRRQRQAEKDAKKGSSSTEEFKHNESARSNQSVGDTIIPREYAEDVEFVEYKEFSQTTTILTEETPESGGKSKFKKVKVETQVSDVEFVEIK